jgi:Penicillinase repressor
MSWSNLTEREWKIIDHITKHPGCSKQDVVRGMDGDPSRITVLNILDQLEAYKMIIAKKKKPNSQIYNLYINNENIIISEKQRLDDFKNRFLHLLEKAKEKINMKEQVDHGPPRIPKVRKKVDTGKPAPYSVVFENKLHLMRALSIIYRHFIGIYYIATLFSWPERIKNKEDLDKLYELVFSTIHEIQSKLADVLPRREDNTQSSPFTKKMLYKLFELSPPLIPFIIDTFEKYELEKDLKPALETLWNAPFNFLPYETLADFLWENTGGDVKNWKDLTEVIQEGKEFVKWLERKNISTKPVLPRIPHFWL